MVTATVTKRDVRCKKCNRLFFKVDSELWKLVRLLLAKNWELKCPNCATVFTDIP